MMRSLLISLFLCSLLSPDAASADSRGMDEQHHCLSLALYWEARGESRNGVIAVGWTILNRVSSTDFPGTVCGVIFQGGEQPPCQFSWWCDGKSDRPRNAESWRRVRVIAAELLNDPPRDPTRGALFYHTNGIAVPWKRPRTRTAIIGGHVFYR